MAGGKVSVRQKMINMMYLVLTALLALNVSKDILHAFHLVEVSMNKSGVNIDQKNDLILSAFKADFAKRPEKVGPFYDKAKKADKIAGDFVKYVDELKAKVEEGAGGRKNEGDPQAELAMNDNIEMHANMLINEGVGAELKAKINKTREDLLALLDKEDKKRVTSDLIAVDPEGENQTWESELFEHSPAAAVVTLFEKIKNDAKNTEAQVLDQLAKAIDKSSQTFDQVTAKIIPKSGFVMSGGKFEADIMLVAYDSKQQNDVVINGSLRKKSSTSYIAKVSKRGEAIIRVSVKMDDGTTKSMGQAKFRVRNIPKPVAQLGTLQNGQVSSVGTIRANANRIYGSLGEGFAFEGIKYIVKNFVFLYVPRRGEPKTIRGVGQNLPGAAKNLIRRMKSGDRILLDQIRAKGPDGTRNLAPVIITAR